MARSPRPSMRRLWLALFLGCIMSGVFLLLVELFFVPFVIMGTGGIVIATALAAWIVFKGQQSILYAITRWRLPLPVLVLSALPGLAIGYLAIRAGLGIVTGAIPGCAMQAVVLRIVAGGTGVGAGAPAVPAAAASPLLAVAVPLAAPAPAPIAEPDPLPPLAPDTSNPVHRGFERAGG